MSNLRRRSGRTCACCLGLGVIPSLLAISSGTGPLLASDSVSVDLELVIAADVSTSMELAEKQLQRRGFADAFRNPAIVDAIAAGDYGRIAITYMEWGGPNNQKVVVPWVVIADRAGAEEFADQLERTFPGKLRRGTSIGGALSFAAHLLDANEFSGVRRVVNLSGDGTDNTDSRVANVRADVLARGITINGLPIVYELAPGDSTEGEASTTPEALVEYYKREVIGGPGAFVESVAAAEDLQAAIERKLLREIRAPLFSAANETNFALSR
jgi:Protein of unknown function (DUF1194)